MSPSAPHRLSLGLDVGGTSTRAVLSSLDGAVVGRGRAGGGNPVARGTDAAGVELLAAMRTALSGTDPATVGAVVIGLAGAVAMGRDPAVRTMLHGVLAQAGLTCGYRLVADPVVAFAAGTDRPDGTVLIAGTGAVAAAVRGRELDCLADGHGWLLGDVGSGFWLGREAVRRTLRMLDNGRDVSELAAMVLTELTGSADVADDPRDTVNAVIRVVHAQPPVTLARLAPLVMSAYLVGDRSAIDLIGDAADQLVTTVSVARRVGERTPIVLAGSLLTNDTPLASAVRARLDANWLDAPLRTAGDAAAAAAWLAAVGLGPTLDPGRLHARLLGPTG